METNIDKTCLNVASYLERFIGDIENHYSWPFNLDKAYGFTHYDFTDEKNWYQKTKVLKTVLQTKLNNSEGFSDEVDIARFFIKDWGGVRIQESQLLELVSKYSAFKGSDSRKASELNIQGVSSWSKYLSLICNWAPIYDSRVAYSINTINFLAGNTDIFFKMVEGRSSRLKLLDISTLFLQEKLRDGSVQLSDFEHKQFASKLLKNFTTKNEDTYLLYTKLVLDVATKLNASFHDIEMLLFALAPKNISFELLTKYQTQ